MTMPPRTTIRRTLLLDGHFSRSREVSVLREDLLYIFVSLIYYVYIDFNNHIHLIMAAQITDVGTKSWNQSFRLDSPRSDDMVNAPPITYFTTG